MSINTRKVNQQKRLKFDVCTMYKYISHEFKPSLRMIEIDIANGNQYNQIFRASKSIHCSAIQMACLYLFTSITITQGKSYARKLLASLIRNKETKPPTASNTKRTTHAG